MPPTPTPSRLRILMLHGYTQSGPVFRAKTRALEKNLQKAFPGPRYAVTLVFPTAPIKVRAADIPGFSPVTSTSTDTSTNTGTSAQNNASSTADDTQQELEQDTDAWAWWQRRGTIPGSYTYTGIETGLARVAATLVAEGPFDGVVGFSQGGALAGMVASLLEPGRRGAFERKGGMGFPGSFLESEGGNGGRDGDRGGGGEGMGEGEGDGEGLIHPPLSFAVSYSGFSALDANAGLYAAFYDPPIKTPMLHFIGSVDTVVEEGRSLRLVEACVEGGEGKVKDRVVRHPGGHWVPSSQRQYVGALVGFVREVMGWEETRESQKQVNGVDGEGKKGIGKEDDLDDFPF